MSEEWKGRLQTQDLVIDKEKLKSAILFKYGTFSNFCRRNNLNYGAFKVWLVRGFKSRIYSSIIRDEFKDAIIEDLKDKKEEKETA